MDLGTLVSVMRKERLCFKKFQIIGMFHRAINIFFVLYSVYQKLTSHRSPMRYQENEKFFPFEYGTLKSILNVKVKS